MTEHAVPPELIRRLVFSTDRNSVPIHSRKITPLGIAEVDCAFRCVSGGGPALAQTLCSEYDSGGRSGCALYFSELVLGDKRWH